MYVAVHLWEARGRGLAVESSSLGGPGLETSSGAHGWQLQAGWVGLTQPREQAAQDAAVLDGLLHHEPVLVQPPGGQQARVRGGDLVQDLQVGDELPHLCPVVVVLGHLQGEGAMGGG